ncbi:unnamed protein product [Somion occarium]|uniref:Abscisic acid G-protein coupled receptor-like domain-containing protein n=1 Tax=Somion occarium TaxID=3059160 RepID=A0ABP1DDQ3_9APHY
MPWLMWYLLFHGFTGKLEILLIRLVLRGVARVLCVTSRNLGASPMLLILAQLMGIYLSSILLQLRTSFPPPPSRPDTEPDNGTINLFSTLPSIRCSGRCLMGHSFWLPQRV